MIKWLGSVVAVTNFVCNRPFCYSLSAVCVNPKQKTVTVCLVKTSPSLSWYSLGSSAPEDADLIAARDYQSRRYFRKVNLVVREQITHDTYLFTFEMPKGNRVNLLPQTLL